jgi:hypothetical protein
VPQREVCALRAAISASPRKVIWLAPTPRTARSRPHAVSQHARFRRKLPPSRTCFGVSDDPTRTCRQKRWCSAATRALLSAYIAVKVVNRLKSQSDYIEKRIDDACADIRSVADLATDYWNKPATNELRPTEARIAARIRLIMELRQAIAAAAPEIGSERLTEVAQDFLRTVTGGDFGVHNRVQDAERACAVQYVATRFIGEIRRARAGVHYPAAGAPVAF